jgi:hypothetical protein
MTWVVRRCEAAMSNASRTIPASGVSRTRYPTTRYPTTRYPTTRYPTTRYPTTRRRNTSSTMARYRNHAAVGMYVMSATQS